MSQKVVLLYSPGVGTKSHATSCTVPACRLLSQRARFKPVLVTGSCFHPNEGQKDYEWVSLDVDFSSSNDASHFTRLGPLGKPVRVSIRIAKYWRHLDLLCDFLNSRSDIDVVHFWDYEYVALSHFIRHRLPPHLKIVVTVYQSDYNWTTLSLKALYKQFIYARFRHVLLKASGIIVFGDFIRDKLISDMKFSEQESQRIFVARYHAGSSVPAIGKIAARQRLGIRLDARVVLFFGVVRHDKRLDLIIKACAHSQCKPFLIIAGSPWTLSEKTVRRWVAESGLQDRVLAHVRWIEDAEIPAYYEAADLFLSAYDKSYVGQSGPLNMCRAFRLPAVVADAGELGYYVRNTGVGLLAEPGECLSFAEKIDQYFGSKELRDNLEEALVKAEGAFSWDYFVGQLEACYDHALRLS